MICEGIRTDELLRRLRLESERVPMNKEDERRRLERFEALSAEVQRRADHARIDVC